MVLPFLALHLKDHLGSTASLAAQLMSVYGIGSVAGAILGGRLTAKFGAMPIMKASLLGTAPMFIALLFSNSLSTAAVSIFALAIVGDMIRPAGMTATTELCEGKDLSRAFALTRLAINLGMSIGPAFAGLLYVAYFELIFVIDAVTCLAAALLLAKLFPRKTGQQRSNHRQVSSAAEPASKLTFGQLLVVLALFGFAMLFFLQLIGTFPIYLREERGLSEIQIGILFTVNTGLIVVFEMVLIRCINRFSRLPVIAVGAVLILLGFGMLPLGSGGPFIFATVCVWTLGEMLSMPMLSTWVSECSSPAQRSKNLSYVTATFSLAWVFAPIVGGASYAVNPDLLWYSALAFAPLLAAGFFVVISKQRLVAQPQ
jgi:predicted MFS family arabinose efflux permease